MYVVHLEAKQGDIADKYCRLRILTCMYVVSASGVTMVLGETDWRGVTVASRTGFAAGAGDTNGEAKDDPA
jgi:hypothetical protein